MLRIFFLLLSPPPPSTCTCQDQNKTFNLNDTLYFKTNMKVGSNSQLSSMLSCVFPFPGELMVDSPACLSLSSPETGLLPGVFGFSGTPNIDYSCVDLPDKHMILFSLYWKASWYLECTVLLRFFTAFLQTNISTLVTAVQHCLLMQALLRSSVQRSSLDHNTAGAPDPGVRNQLKQT